MKSMKIENVHDYLPFSDTFLGAQKDHKNQAATSKHSLLRPFEYVLS